MTLLEAMADRNLFAPWFKDHATWTAWRAFLAALFALTMTDDQFAIFKESTGRSQPPQQPATEAWLVCGRRAGKSFVETVPYYSKMLMALAASVPTIFQDRAGTLRPEGLRATGSSNARPRWR